MTNFEKAESEFAKPLLKREIGKGIKKCSKCGKNFGTIEDVPEGSVSHGYCPECAKIAEEETSREIERLKRNLK